MAIKIGINGLGRIGRCVVRALVEMPRDDIELVAVNGPAPIETHLHLLRYDSTHGFCGSSSQTGNNLLIDGKEVRLTHEREPEKIDWNAAGVDVVLECTGIFKKHAEASRHLGGSVKTVVVSAPSPDADNTIVYGVNHDTYESDQGILSAASCTTNCLAPVAKVLQDNFGIETGFVTTIHAYTGDQNLLDNSHKDLRRARSAAMSMVPTSTGAARTIGKILPALDGKLDGTAIRVPTPNVSLVDLTFTSAKPMSNDSIHKAMQEASKGAMKGILGYSDAPLVSCDFNHNPASSVYDVTGTQVMGDHFARIAAWYDNEWAFSVRMLDVAGLVNKNRT